MKYFITGFAFIFLISCSAKQINIERITSANYGKKPTLEQLDSKIRNYLVDSYSHKFFDPDSAKIKCSEPTKGWHRFNITKEPSGFGYISICKINAKNRLGGYTGYEEYLTLLTPERLIFRENKHFIKKGVQYDYVK